MKDNNTIYINLFGSEDSFSILSLSPYPLIQSQAISSDDKIIDEMYHQGSVIISIDGYHIAQIYSIHKNGSPSFLGTTKEDAMKWAKVGAKNIMTTLVVLIKELRNSDSIHDVLVSWNRNDNKWQYAPYPDPNLNLNLDLDPEII